jgi:hypothetical protein
MKSPKMANPHNALVALEKAEQTVIDLYGISVFRATKETNWEWIELNKKRNTCLAVQAYFKALEAHEAFEQEYMRQTRL